MGDIEKLKSELHNLSMSMYLANAIGYPRAMVVKLFNTTITSGTVLCTKRPDNLMSMPASQVRQMCSITKYEGHIYVTKVSSQWHLARCTELRPITS